MSAFFDFVNRNAERHALEQGATFFREMFWKNNQDGTPHDLEGATAKMQARKTSDADPIFTLTTENGGIDINVAEGKITLSMPASVTEALVPGFYFYDIYLTREDTIRFLEGRIEVTGGITRC